MGCPCAFKIADPPPAAAGARAQPRHIYRSTLRHFWPRLLVTSLAWLANDFAFYGARARAHARAPPGLLRPPRLAPASGAR